jgi:hypothetical protein
MDYNTHLFLSGLTEKQIPKGYYADGKGKGAYTESITEELLKKTLSGNLGYNDLFRYSKIAIRQMSEKNKITFNLENTVRFIMRYLTFIREGNMDVLEKIAKKAWFNGNAIKKAMQGKGKNNNQIIGIALRMNNCLANEDTHGFYSIYLQLITSCKAEFTLGSQEEFTDSDNLIQFGMNFISGLLSSEFKSKDKESK